MIDVAEAVRRVVVAGAPVLCLDTSALLDLMRDPTREKFSGAHASAALYLLARAEASPPALSLLLAEQVDFELNDHMDEIQRESERAVQRLDDTLNQTLGIIAAHGLVVPTTLTLSALGFPAAARANVVRFVSVAHTVREDDVCVTRARDRVRLGRAPATRAKQSFKDCLIIETYLHIARELRAAGFAEKILFLTTNTADYTDRLHPTLHGDLAPEFASVGMDFASSFLAARYTLFRA